MYAYYKEAWNFFKVEKHCPVGLIIPTIIIANVCEHLHFARLYAKQFPYIIFFNPHHDPLCDTVTIPILLMRPLRLKGRVTCPGS